MKILVAALLGLSSVASAAQWLDVPLKGQADQFGSCEYTGDIALNRFPDYEVFVNTDRSGKEWTKSAAIRTTVEIKSNTSYILHLSHSKGDRAVGLYGCNDMAAKVYLRN